MLVEIHPSPNRPHHSIRLGPDDGVFVRVGSTNRRADPVLIEELKQAIINTIFHADYAQRGAPIQIALFDDRLEMENPGLLPSGLTIEDIQQGISKLCNWVIGRVFQELGLIEQWGSGIQRMTAACRDSDLGSPKFEEIGTHIRVTISTVRTVPFSTTLVTSRYSALAASGSTGLSTSEIGNKLDVSPRATRT